MTNSHRRRMLSESGKKLKVAFVTQFPIDPSSPRGGVEAVSVHLIKALSGFKDLEPHIVTFCDESSEYSNYSWQNITIHRLASLKGSTLVNALYLGRQQIRHFLQELNPDVIHAHDTYGIMVKGIPIPRVFTVHGFIHSNTLVSGGRWAQMRSWVWWWIETSAWADQHYIIAISPYVRERLSGIAKGTIYDIENPVPKSFFLSPRKEGKGIIFSAATISPGKNTLMLVNAFKKIIDFGCDAKLRLAGEIKNVKYANTIKEYIKRNELEDRVCFLGRISTEKVVAELTQASVFALVSLDENSPMGIEEAMAVGIPVVASNLCGMPYLVRHCESGFLVNPHCSNEIADRLMQLLEDSELRIAMGEKAKAIALDRFHPENISRKTLAVYFEAVHNFRKDILCVIK